MQADHVNACIQAVATILEQRAATTVERGEPDLVSAHCTRHDVTALLGISGDLRGLLLVGMSTATARRVASALAGEPFSEFDRVAQDTICELGGFFSRKASLLLREAGLAATVSAPTLLMGRGTLFTARKLPHVVIPLRTGLGDLDVSLVLPPVSGRSASPGERPGSRRPSFSPASS